MRTFRQLESKTPCITCQRYISSKETLGKVYCKAPNNKNIVGFLDGGGTKRACKDYKEIEVKNSLFKKLLKFISWKR